MFKRQNHFESLGIAIACAALLAAAGCAGKRGHAPKEKVSDGDPASALTGDKNVVQKLTLDPKMIGDWVSDCIFKDDGSYTSMATFATDGTVTITRTTYADGSCKQGLQSSLVARATVELLERSDKGAKIACHYDPKLAKDPGDMLESTESVTWTDADNYETRLLAGTYRTATGSRAFTDQEAAAEGSIRYHRVTTSPESTPQTTDDPTANAL